MRYAQVKFDEEVVADLETWQDYLDRFVEQLDSREYREALILEGLLEDAQQNPKSFLGLRDADGVLQAAATIYKQLLKATSACVRVDYLMSAPWNRWGRDPRAVPGSGKSLLTRIVKSSVRLGYSGRVELVSSPDAVAFYLGLGFVRQANGKMVLRSADAYQPLSGRRK